MPLSLQTLRGTFRNLPRYCQVFGTGKHFLQPPPIKGKLPIRFINAIIPKYFDKPSEQKKRKTTDNTITVTVRHPQPHFHVIARSFPANTIFVRNQSTSAMSNNTDTPDMRANRLIWVDLEMTGLDFVNDTILEVACLVTEGDLTLVAEGPNIIIHHSDKVLNSMGEWCIKHHGESGLTDAVKKSKISLEEAEKMVLDFVSQHTPKGTCPLAGNTIGMDRSFILQHMPKLAEHLHHRVVDVSSVKELCRRWYPQELKVAPVKKDNHRAMDDILESIEELRYYRSAIFK